MQKNNQVIKGKIYTFGGLDQGHINAESHDDDDMWIGKSISKGLRNVRCLGCGKQGHLKGECKQGIPRKNVYSTNNGNIMSLLSGLCRRCVERVNIGPRNVDQQETDKVILCLYPWETPRGASCRPPWQIQFRPFLPS